ncbi:hypothetical protein BH18ACT5_BH18ACT5_12590 [soil metagenome]
MLLKHAKFEPEPVLAEPGVNWPELILAVMMGLFFLILTRLVVLRHNEFGPSTTHCFQDCALSIDVEREPDAMELVTCPWQPSKRRSACRHLDGGPIPFNTTFKGFPSNKELPSTDSTIHIVDPELVVPTTPRRISAA